MVKTFALEEFLEDLIDQDIEHPGSIGLSRKEENVTVVIGV